MPCWHPGRRLGNCLVMVTGPLTRCALWPEANAKDQLRGATPQGQEGSLCPPSQALAAWEPLSWVSQLAGSVHDRGLGISDGLGSQPAARGPAPSVVKSEMLWPGASWPLSAITAGPCDHYLSSPVVQNRQRDKFLMNRSKYGVPTGLKLRRMNVPILQNHCSRLLCRTGAVAPLRGLVHLPGVVEDKRCQKDR